MLLKPIVRSLGEGYGAQQIHGRARIWRWVIAQNSHFRESYRWDGARTAVCRATKRILKPLIEINRFLFFEADLTQPKARLGPRIPLAMRVVTAVDVAADAER